MTSERGSPLPTSTDDIVGGRYRVGPLIGHGGMADVFAAFDESLQRPVALKRLRSEHAGDADLRRRFSREARATGRITHPNVVAIFDVGSEDEAPFFVMERLPGRTLHDELHAGPIPMPRLRMLAAEILGGLDAAHRHGILHRDMKPANVLLDERGHAKVGDFGVALVRDDVHHTSTGLVLGTLAYLPPERLAGGPATAGGDLYATGILLFEAATGRAAFRADSPLALAHAVSHDVPSFDAGERARLDPVFVDAVERATAKDPAARFTSADAMRAALIDADDLSPARRATVPVRTSVPRTERLVAAPSPPQPAPETPASGDRPGRHRLRRLIALAVVLVAVLVTTVAVLARSGADGDPARPTPVTTTPSGSTPPRLAHALDELDRAIGR